MSIYDFFKSVISDEKGTAKELIENDFIVFDFETTGFYASRGDRVISVGGVKVLRGKLDIKNNFYSLVNPEMKIPEVITKLTGINNEDVEKERSFDAVMEDFIRWADDGTEDPIAAGHAVDFDLSFLKDHRKTVPLFKKCLDTRTLISMVYPGLGNKSLFHIAEYLELKIITEHNALDDAILTAEVLIVALNALKSQKIRTFESLDRMIRSQRLIMPS